MKKKEAVLVFNPREDTNDTRPTELRVAKRQGTSCFLLAYNVFPSFPFILQIPRFPFFFSLRFYQLMLTC